MGCVKLFYTSEQVIHDCNIPDTLYSLLNDRDEMVVANCVVVLEEILAKHGGIQITQEIAHRLMQNLKNFPPWSQCQLMAILVRYVPADDDDVFDILNVLDDRLKHANSGVVLAAGKLFLHFTRDMDSDVLDDVYMRLKTPLITLMASGLPELRFTLLHHLEMLLLKYPNLLELDFQSFFCQYNEPSYVKIKKLEILTSIATETNFTAIVEELAAYITDVDVAMARRSITAMGKIAAKFDAASEHILSMLVLFFELNRPYITADTLVVLQDVLRVKPDLAPDVVARLPDLYESDMLDDEPEARTALIWMLGEFGADVDSAPYMLEEIVANIEAETSHVVRLQLLVTSMKLFFIRAPEMQATLGKLFEFCIDEEEHQDVHDRALLYYRLLQSNFDEARRVVGTTFDAVEAFAESENLLSADVFKEFNTLSVIYGQPAITFVEQQHPYNTVGVGEGAPVADAGSAVGDLLGGAASGTQGGGGQGGGGGGGGVVGDLLDIGMFSSSNAPEQLKLDPNPKISPQMFESKWTQLEISMQIKDILKSVPTPAHFEQLMAAAKIKTLAVQPPQNGLLKFYMFGQEMASKQHHLLEVVVNMTTRFLTATIKSDNFDTSGDFAIVFRGALSGAFEAM
jgi:AP-4 complex subunit beta-1